MINDHSSHHFQIQLSRALAKKGYTVLHTHCVSFLTPKGNLEKNKADAADFSIRGVGFLFWMQDALGVGYRTALRRRLFLVGDLLGKAFQLYERLLVARSDATIVITKDFIPYLPKSVRERDTVTIVENWAPLDELPLTSKCNHWSNKCGLAKTTNFLYSGTLGLKHNPALLYRLAQATSKYPNVRIVVISEGPGAEWLAQQQRQEKLMNLVLMPFQPFEKIPEMLASADVLVALLEKEAGPFAVPSKVLTYLCAKRPLLLAVPGENLSAKIVRQNHAGVTVEPDNVNGLIYVSAKDDSSSLLKIGLEQDRIYPGTAEVRTESINVVRLADVISASDLSETSLLKLDVQGFELHTLKGCTELLTCFSWIYCECSFIELYKRQALAHEIIQWLHEHHFVLTGVYNISYGDDGQAVQADFLFGKSNAAAK